LKNEIATANDAGLIALDGGRTGVVDYRGAQHRIQKSGLSAVPWRSCLTAGRFPFAKIIEFCCGVGEL